MLIKATDFKGEVFVSSTLEEFGNENNLQYFIDKYASQLLLYCIGKDLFETLKIYLDDDKMIKEDAPEEWKEFSEFAKEPLLFYVFWYYYKNENSQLIISSKNSSTTNINQKLVNVWNEFLRLYQGNICTTPTVVYINNIRFTDYLGTNIENIQKSLVQYVIDTFEYNDSIVFSNSSNSNSLGI